VISATSLRIESASFPIEKSKKAELSLLMLEGFTAAA
jgi:hypothetical protein